ncbi:serine protease HTRA1-like [Clavelina lepadiformis]|uniref:serine protease HTRA1-like n=1 Tax=Clavelina lepadiformis TaxID=159417 RepID=UPI0040424A66
MSVGRSTRSLLSKTVRGFMRNNGTSLSQNFCRGNLAVVSFHHGSNRDNSSKSKRKNERIFNLLVPACGFAAGYITFDALKCRHSQTLAAELDPKSPFRGSGNRGNIGNRRKAFNFVADVVEVAGPAVVYIERLQKIPFIQQAVPIANGSGFIVDSTGLIITNAHVVGNQSNLNVKLPDGREFQGRVVGIDESRDIAAVKINGSNLPRIELGTTKDLRPGEWVVAIGSPLALKNTVTAGIVSNMCRAGKELGLQHGEKRDMEYIQTDATINVGNSGGPLVNLDGQVIGINTMMASAGIGFAIPVDYVQEFLQQLRSASGYTSRVSPKRRWIGITMLSLTPDIAMQLRSRNPNFPDINEGVYVHRVQPDSPAYLAGVQDGDVIMSINGSQILTTSDVMNAMKRDQVLNVHVKRGTRGVVLRVVAEELAH